MANIKHRVNMRWSNWVGDTQKAQAEPEVLMVAPTDQVFPAPVSVVSEGSSETKRMEEEGIYVVSSNGTGNMDSLPVVSAVQVDPALESQGGDGDGDDGGGVIARSHISRRNYTPSLHFHTSDDRGGGTVSRIQGETMI